MLVVQVVGQSTSYQYDADGNETMMVQGYGTASASSTSMAYDAEGDETLVVTGLGTSAAESAHYAYDADGNQTQAITGYSSTKPETTTSSYRVNWRFKTSHLWALQNQPGFHCLVHMLPFARRACPS